MLGLRLADELEDDTPSSVYVDHSGDSEDKAKRARSCSLPASELVAAETEADAYDLSNTDQDQDSVALLRAPGWTEVDGPTPTAGAEIETVL